MNIVIQNLLNASLNTEDPLQIKHFYQPTSLYLFTQIYSVYNAALKADDAKIQTILLGLSLLGISET